MLQLRDTYTLVGKICAVRGFQVAHTNEVVLDLDRAVPARDCRIIDRHIRIRTSYDDARLLHGIDHAASRPRDYGKGDSLPSWEAQANLFIAASARKSGRTCAPGRIR